MRIDADAHVIESEHTWDYLLPDEERFRPVALTSADGDQLWLIEGRTDLRGGGDRTIAAAVRQLDDVPGRLAAMDAYGVDVQVLYPTMFLQPPTTRVDCQVALCRSYNRWLGEIADSSAGRLRWAVLPPLLDIPTALQELHWASEHGAVAVFLRGIEGDLLLDDPRLQPLYETASDLNLPICVHAGNGSRQIDDVVLRKDLFYFAVTPILAAFVRVVVSGLPERHPKLRFAFIEAGSDWIPYLVREVARRSTTIGIRGEFTSLTTLLADKRIWVTCRSDDDLPHVLDYSGTGQLVIGTDFGHIDPAAEIEALDHLATSGSVDVKVLNLILDDNPRALYGL